jgi:hypothetical protein
MIVDANSLNNGRLKAFLVGREDETEIGIDYFRASSPVEPDFAHKIASEFAKQRNIPDTEFLVRSRLPKTNVKARKLDDSAATNLTLVKNEEKVPESKEPVDSNNLTTMAQAMVDAHNKRKDDVKPEPVKEEQKASADKPHGATVKRTEQEKKPRRAYQKKDKERSAKSKAAYERYLKEISAASAESPTFMEAAKPGPGVSEADVDEATLQFALKLAKLLKGVM